MAAARRLERSRLVMTRSHDPNGPATIPTARRRPKADVLELGGRKLKPATLMMGHGFDPALSEGALKPPIFLTSTFVFESAAAGKRFFEHITGKREGPAEGLVYSRFNGPDQEILEDRLSLWEEAEDRSVEHTSELQSLIRITYAVFCLKTHNHNPSIQQHHRY